MHTKTASWIAGLLFFACITAAPAQENFQESTDRQKFQKIIPVIDNWLNYQAFKSQIPGIAAGIMHVDEVLLDTQYGLADLVSKEKLQPEHVFCCASHSKMFTTTAILLLHQAGKIRLEDKVSRHLPWFSSPDQPSLAEITIFHLLTHTAGIITDARLSNGYPPYQIEHVKEIVQRGISTSKIEEMIKYSNFGFRILGALVEVVTGIPCDQYIEEHILQPLQMTRSAMGLTHNNSDLLAKGYAAWYPDRDREEIEKYVFNRIYGIHSAVGGLVTNAEDLMKFWGAYVTGNQKLFPDSFKKDIYRKQVKIGDNKRGLGYEITDLPAGNHYFQIIGGTFGYHTQSGIVPEDNLAVVVLTTSTNAPVSTYSTGIINLLNFVKTRWNDLQLPSSDLSPTADKSQLGGLYGCPYGVYYIIPIGDKLVIFDLDSLNPASDPVILEPCGKNKFVSSVQLFFAKENEPVEFKPDDQGKMILYDSLGRPVERFSFDSYFRL